MFEDIRPYRDNEVAGVLQKLSNEPELINAVATFLAPSSTKYLPGITRKAVQWSLKRKIRHWRTIDDIQLHVADYLHKLVEN
ncbi:MAG: hypothetical protein ACPG46_12610, partial [Thalassotalea sp.]